MAEATKHVVKVRTTRLCLAIVRRVAWHFAVVPEVGDRHADICSTWASSKVLAVSATISCAIESDDQ